MYASIKDRDASRDGEKSLCIYEYPRQTNRVALSDSLASELNLHSGHCSILARGRPHHLFVMHSTSLHGGMLSMQPHSSHTPLSSASLPTSAPSPESEPEYTAAPRTDPPPRARNNPQGLSRSSVALSALSPPRLSSEPHSLGGGAEGARARFLPKAARRPLRRHTRLSPSRHEALPRSPPG